MAGTEQDAGFWAAVEQFISTAEASLAFAQAPRVVAFPYPGEEWKEQIQLDDKEEACLFATQEILKTYCQKRVWPSTWPVDSAYFARARLEWARRWVRIMRVPWERTGQPFMVRPPETGYELVEWLVTTAYENRNPPAYNPPMKVWMPKDSHKPE